ncbi:MAG: HEAT repeat domain-containing protein [Candidatus Lokiarchaeota archaeon]|nr:HEAT repeat domain-containing protein [Candidatus Lokiarchaeota archaeon]
MPDSNLLPQEIFDKREEYGLENSVEMLTDIIETDKDNSKRKSAIKFLGGIIKYIPKLNNECFTTLENILISELNIDIKCEAANALGKLKNEKSLKPLKWTLEQKSADVDLRLAVLKAIMKTKFKEPQITIFINELDSEYSSIREYVRSQLVGLEPEILINILLDNLESDSISNKHKSEIIKLIGYELSSINISFQDMDYIKVKYPEVVSSLLRNKAVLLEQITRRLKNEDIELINSATLILRLLSPEINKDVIKLLLSDDFIIRKNAITIVGKLKIKDAVESLISGLDNIYSEVSVATIEALGEIGDVSSVPELLDILNVEDISFEYTDIDMKFYIMDAVKKIYLSNKGANYDYLFSNLDSNSETLKESIAFILGEIGNEEFTDPITKLLKTRNLDVKKNAIIALGKIGNVNPITHLIEILENPNSYWLIKKVAIDAIYNIFQRNWYRIKENNVEFKRTLTKHIATLIELLKKSEAENAKVKVSLIKFLENFGDEPALSALLARVNDFPRIVRIHCSNAIKKIEEKIEERLGLDTVD